MRVLVHGPIVEGDFAPYVDCCFEDVVDLAPPAVVVREAADLVTCTGPDRDGYSTFTERFSSVAFAGIDYLDPVTGEARQRELTIR